jgi:hypothetical protein
MQRCLASVVAVLPDGGAAMAPQGEPSAGNEAGRIITRIIPFPWNGPAMISAVTLLMFESGAPIIFAVTLLIIESGAPIIIAVIVSIFENGPAIIIEIIRLRGCTGVA